MTRKQRKKAAACAYALLSHKYKRTHKCWVREWIKRRANDGVMKKLLGELQREDEQCYKNFLRMSADDFDYLLNRIKFAIEKQNTLMRDAIPAAERLALTLRFLATGRRLGYHLVSIYILYIYFF